MLFRKKKKPIEEPIKDDHVEKLLEELKSRPPLEPYVIITLQNTLPCKEALRKIAVIHDRDEDIDFDEAVQRYYSDKDKFFRWSFPIENVNIVYADDAFDIIGDGIKLGQVKKNNRYKGDYEVLCSLKECNGIEKTVLEIKDGAYFHLTEKEYKALAVEDPFGKGFAAWSDKRAPEITMKVYGKLREAGLGDAIDEKMSKIITEGIE